MTNIVGSYLKAKVKLPVYIVPIVTSDFLQIGTLEPGEIYPVLVNRVVTIGSKTWAIFNVSNTNEAIAIGANETWIPLQSDNLTNQVTTQSTASSYIAPPSKIEYLKKIGIMALVGLSGVYLFGKYLSKK